MKRHVLLAMAAVLCCTTAGWADENKPGAAPGVPGAGGPPKATLGLITYPAAGNLQLDEGTVEMWVICEFDPRWDSKLASSWAMLNQFYFPDENWHYVISYLSWGKALAMVGYAMPAQPYVWCGAGAWEPGKAYHVVFTWSGRKRSVYVDGVCEWMGAKGKGLSRDVDVGSVIHGDLTRAQIRMGHGYFILDEVQVRNVALTHAEIVATKDAPLAADAHTLLLDRCDGEPAEIISGRSGETGATLGNGCHVVEAKFGNGYRTWKKVE